MKNYFTKEDLAEIYADPFDKSRQIYACAKYPKRPTIFPNTYTIKCSNLPLGLYIIRNKKIRFFASNEPTSQNNNNRGFKTGYFEYGYFGFEISAPNTELKLKIENCIAVDDIIIELREKAIINRTKNNKTLIEQDIIYRSNFGEEYNRESFYNTIYDCLDDDETLLIDMSKSVQDPDVKQLRLASISQQKNRLKRQIENLNKEEQELLK